MRIAQLVQNLHSVNPIANHAIYSHAGQLSDKLVEKGHDMTLFASGDSITKAKLESIHPIAFSKDPSLLNKKQSLTLAHISKCFEQACSFDIIHSHYTLLASYFSGLTKTPTVTTIHSPITDDIKEFLLQNKDKRYISYSYAQRRQLPELNWIANIYHGVDTNAFAYNETPQDYVLFLGRMTEEKGAHVAIEAAKLANVKIKIAGTSYSTEGYWQRMIEPHINGTTVNYVGEADFEDKIHLLQNAKALVFPTQYNEVFGYVMIEAMSCGTPVIAYGNGSVPEIVRDGHSGFVVNDLAGIVEAIKKIDQIDRREVRKRAERFFSIEKMVNGYEAVYQKVIDKIIK